LRKQHNSSKAFLIEIGCHEGPVFETSPKYNDGVRMRDCI